MVIGAGADELILLLAHTFLGPGTQASIQPPTYALYRIATLLRAATATAADDVADVYWRCNPNNPTGEVVEPEELVELARRSPTSIVVVDEAYVEFGARSAAPWVDELPNLVVLRTLSKAFGLAALRVGYALAHPDTAALLDARRAPASISAPAARIAAAALAEPRLLDLEPTIAERERMRHALLAAGHDAPPAAGNFVWIRTTDPLADELERQGIVVAGLRGGNSRHGAAAVRERRPAARTRRRAGTAARSRSDGDPHHDRDRAAADADDRRHAAVPVWRRGSASSTTC